MKNGVKSIHMQGNVRPDGWIRKPALIAFILVVLCGAFSVQAADSATNLVQLKGRVAALPNSTNLQFRVDGGKILNLLPSRDAQALFADTNLHSRTLLLKGRVNPREQTLEVIGNLHEVRKGKVYELYYYCSICSIETSFPGPCLCCREPVELRERAAKK